MLMTFAQICQCADTASFIVHFCCRFKLKYINFVVVRNEEDKYCQFKKFYLKLLLDSSTHTSVCLLRASLLKKLPVQKYIKVL